MSRNQALASGSPPGVDRNGKSGAEMIALLNGVASTRGPLGLVASAISALILFVADSFPDEVREEKQEP